MERYASVITVRSEKLDYYRQLHAQVWPGVLKMIEQCNMRNYSIFLREVELGKYFLFSYYEYIGTDRVADRKKMAADPETQRWWKETLPCQQPIPLAQTGEGWSRMEELFHHAGD